MRRKQSFWRTRSFSPPVSAALRGAKTSAPSSARRLCRGCAPTARVWGVGLAADSAERASLLAAFLRAREWDVDDAATMLAETFAWRRAQSIDGKGAAPHALDGLFPDDEIRTVAAPDGRRKTYVVLKLGALTRDAFADAGELVAWRVRMAERACEHLGAADAGGGSRWSEAPRGPTYTLVLDCAGLRPFHFSGRTRAALGGLKDVFEHFYPDFVGDILVVNTPGFVRRTWGILSRLMPDWWNVGVGDLSDIGEAP